MRKWILAAILPALVAVVAPAQQAAQQNTVVEIHVNRPKPGMQQQYESGRKRHMAWHKSQNDKWSWLTYEIMTGDSTGSYVVGSFGHSWKDFDGREKFQQADTADANANVVPSLQSDETSYWVFRRDMSNSQQPEGSSPYVSVTHFMVAPDGVSTFVESAKKVVEGIAKTNYPGKPGRWYVLANGGAGPHFVLVQDRKSIGDLQAPDKTLDDMMKEAFGDEGTATLNNLRKTIRSTYTELLQLRPDLSYMAASQ